jgi:iron-sulfur cluster insertion protein
MVNNITIEESALKKIESVISEETPYFRVFVTGGGCSGFKYGFTLDDKPAEDDSVLNVDNIKIVIDPISLPYLEETTIQYIEDIMSSSFNIINPQAKATCGCGESFTV